MDGSPSDLILLNRKFIVVAGENVKLKNNFLKVYKYSDYWAKKFTLESYGLDNATIQGLSFNKLNNKLFIAYNANKISVFDSEYDRLVKTYPVESVTDSLELTSIELIACNDDFLYVFDASKQQIFIFNLNLEYVNKFKIDFKPHQMKANNETICFSISGSVYFFNIKTRLFIHKFECKVGKINVIDSIFYVFDYQLKKYYIFDAHGAFFGEIDAKKVFSFNATEDDGTFTFDGKLLLVASYSTKKIIRIKSEFEDKDDDE